MRYEDKKFIEILQEASWDEYIDLESLRGTLDGQSVFATQDGSDAMLVLYPESIGRVCMTCNTMDYSLSIRASYEGRAVIVKEIKHIIQRLMDKKIVRLSKK